jgi:hypothetical protein
MAGARDDVVYMAKLCEQAERYEEMVEKMGDVAKMDVRPLPKLLQTRRKLLLQPLV